LAVYCRKCSSFDFWILVQGDERCVVQSVGVLVKHSLPVNDDVLKFGSVSEQAMFGKISTDQHELLLVDKNLFEFKYSFDYIKMEKNFAPTGKIEIINIAVEENQKSYMDLLTGIFNYTLNYKVKIYSRIILHLR